MNKHLPHERQLEMIIEEQAQENIDLQKEIASLNQMLSEENIAHKEEISNLNQELIEENFARVEQFKLLNQEQAQKNKSHEEQLENLIQDHQQKTEEHEQELEALNQSHMKKNLAHEQHLESLNQEHTEESLFHEHQIDTICPKDIRILVNKEELEALNQSHMKKNLVHEQQLESLNQEHSQESLMHEIQLGILTEEHQHEVLIHEQQLEILNKEHVQEILIKDVYAERQAAFTAELSHELRNPLNAIRGGMDVLNEKLDALEPLFPKSEEGSESFLFLKDTVENLRSCTDQQKFILDSFLDFSKIQAGGISLSESIFDITSVCREAIQMMQYIAIQKKLVINVDIPERPYLVKGDALRLKQIILNLLSNAVKFTQEGGIFFTLTEEKFTDSHTQLKITVTDSGIGMDEEEQQRLFKSYSQANPSISEQYGGTGLGLFITKSLVEMMNGDIGVESVKGKGSEFICRIMCARVNQEEQQLYCYEQQAIHLKTSSLEKKLNILIVDDNVVNQKILIQILKEHQCDIAKNGFEALHLVFPNKKHPENSFDLIFMDTKMPGMNGLEATEAIRKIERENKLVPVPIVGISGASEPRDQILALKAGMNDYLVKPINKEQIHAITKQYAEKTDPANYLIFESSLKPKF